MAIITVKYGIGIEIDIGKMRSIYVATFVVVLLGCMWHMAMTQQLDVPTWLCKNCYRGLTKKCFHFMSRYVCTNDNDNLEMLRVYDLLGVNFYGDACMKNLKYGFRNSLSNEYGMLHYYLHRMCDSKR